MAIDEPEEAGSRTAAGWPLALPRSGSGQNRSPMPADLELIRHLEAAADRAWPPAEVRAHDGWELRAAGPGIGRRVNSVAPLDAGLLPLEPKVVAAEAFYRERGLPPTFKLTAAAQPDGLEDFLVGRGYRVDAPVSHSHPVAGALCRADPLPAGDPIPGVAGGQRRRAQPLRGGAGGIPRPPRPGPSAPGLRLGGTPGRGRGHRHGGRRRRLGGPLRNRHPAPPPAPRPGHRR